MARIKVALVAVAAVAMFPGAAEARLQPITTARATALAHQDFWTAAVADARVFSLSEEGQLFVSIHDAGTPVQIHVKCHSAGGGRFTCQAAALRVSRYIGEPSYWEDYGEVERGGCVWYESGWIEPSTMQWPEYTHRGTAVLDRLTRKEWKCR
jgi:anti-sigma factor RsiW